MTKMKIAYAFKNLMLSVPYSQITISMICKATPVSRNGFYYYFEKKQELLEWIIEDDFLKYSLPYFRFETELIASKSIFEYIYKEKDFYKAAYDIDNGNTLRNCLFKAHFISIKEENAQRYGKIKHATTKKMSKEIYTHYGIGGIVEVIIYWISENFATDIDELAENIHLLHTEKLTTIRDNYIY